MDKLNHVAIELNVGNDPSLVIILHRDGTINRQGDGTENIDRNFFIGMTETAPMLDSLAELIDPDFEEYLNKVYDIPEKVGKNCHAEVVLGSETQIKGTRFQYGSESMGPPGPISKFIIEAIKLTDPWYYKQQKIINKAKPKWWQFWK